MEFAGMDKAARSKTGVWKMQEWSNACENVLKTSCKSPTVCEINRSVE